MNKTILFILFIFIMSISSVSVSAACIVQENCTYYAYTNDSNVDAVNISIVDVEGNLLVDNLAMTNITAETFKYVYTHNESGNVLAIKNFYDNASLLSTETESVSVREQEVTENNMVIFGILFLILAISGLLFFASTQTSSNNMTSLRRLPEKVLLFVSGLLMLPVSWYFAIVHVNNTPSLSHLYGPLNTFFAIFILIILALLMFYFYNMLKTLAFDPLVEEDKEDW